jgi:hypothetical protein
VLFISSCRHDDLIKSTCWDKLSRQVNKKMTVVTSLYLHLQLLTWFDYRCTKRTRANTGHRNRWVTETGARTIHTIDFGSTSNYLQNVFYVWILIYYDMASYSDVHIFLKCTASFTASEHKLITYILCTVILMGFSAYPRMRTKSDCWFLYMISKLLDRSQIPFAHICKPVCSSLNWKIRTIWSLLCTLEVFLIVNRTFTMIVIL